MRDLLRLVINRQTRSLRDADIAAANFTPSVADFKPYYQKNILPRVREYETKRIVALRGLRRRALLAIPAGLACAALAIYMAIYQMSHVDPGLLLFGGGAIVSGLTWWTLASVRDYQTSVKDQVYPLIFNFFGPDFRYQRTSPITVASLKASQIIPGYDTEHPGDYVRGTYKDVAIEMLEAKMTETQGTGKNRRTVTVFRGVFVRLEVPKKFKGITLIKKDYGMFNWVSGGGDRQRVRLEDPIFEKQFEVFADDQVEARYLLTTSFMDRLLKIAPLFGSKGLQASFYADKLLLMIPTAKDYFKQTSIFKPTTFVEEINEVLAEMKAFFDIIDILKLNERTGL